MHFHRQQNQNEKKKPTKIEHLSTMVWIHSNDLVFLVSSEKKNQNEETAYARPTEVAASRKRIA